ncbi:response regulator [Paenibacillus sp. MCAF20]
MYRVLIVDDEPWVAYGITRIVDWEELGFKVIGEAYDGLMAISMIEQHKPDVIISDIRMPGLDGIELLTEIGKRKLHTAVILVSGYSEFEYAQQAVKLGAFDYLLKQIEKEALTESIIRLKEKLDDKSRTTTAEPDHFLNDLFDLLDADHKITIHSFLDRRGKRFEYPDYRFICCQYPHATISGGHESAATREGLQYLSFRTGTNKTSILVNYDECNHPSVLLDYMAEQLTDAVHIGISQPAPCSAPIAKLYQEADIAMLSSACRPTSRMIEYIEAAPISELASALLQLELSIKENRPMRVKEMLDAICRHCTLQDLLIDQVTGIYNQIVALIQKYFSSSAVSQQVEYLAYYQAARYGSYKSLFDGLQEVLESQSEADLQPSNEQVKEIIAYIDSRYTEDIVLGDVAKRFSMSIGHLSSLIKKSSGTMYSEYITNKRIQHAKELLSDPALSVQEVVQRVGYKDYFHFNKLFKKHVGITPSKFRKI